MHLGVIFSEEMGPDPLLSASVPLPLALPTTLTYNHLSIVSKNKVIKLNIHWMQADWFFFYVSDYKLWRCRRFCTVV